MRELNYIMSNKSIAFYLIFIFFISLSCRKEKYRANQIQGIWKLTEVSDSTGIIPDSLLRPAYYEFYDCNQPRTKGCSGVLLLKHAVLGDFTIDFLWGITNNNYMNCELPYLKLYNLNGTIKQSGVGKNKQLKITKNVKNYFILKKVKSVTTSY